MQTKRESSATPSIPQHLIPLGKGKFAIVDPEDFDALNRYRWRARKSHSTWYAIRRHRRFGKTSIVFMHRQIVQARPDQQVHHKNHQSLDNRKRNLEPMTQPQHNRIQQVDRISKLRDKSPDDLIHAHR